MCLVKASGLHSKVGSAVNHETNSTIKGKSDLGKDTIYNLSGCVSA